MATRPIRDRLKLIPEQHLQRGARDTSTTVRSSREVFIVHGRDDAAKESVARCLERLALKATVLHEQPNKGRTIIEKFVDHSDVGFAVVLLTPDDVGAVANAQANLKPRARQNVILELGFFLGKLGRERVCTLYKEDLELPSDYDGVVYVRMDDAAAACATGKTEANERMTVLAASTDAATCALERERTVDSVWGMVNSSQAVRTVRPTGHFVGLV